MILVCKYEMLVFARAIFGERKSFVLCCFKLKPLSYALKARVF